MSDFLEVETKYDANEIDRMAFKDLIRGFNPKTFVYVESKDVYYTRGEDEFLRYRMPSFNKLSGEENRAELTFKKKIKQENNLVRLEVNLRVDLNDPKLVHAFCTGLGYEKDFEIEKSCDIYYWDDADIVYYSVKDATGKYDYYLEIEALEDHNFSKEKSWEIVLKYERMLLPLGITPQKRKKLSLFEIYRK